jgi:hypothetical protein
MKRQKTKKSDTIRPRYEIILRRLIAAVRDVRARREMNAAESPATQDAWDRLQLAVLEAEQRLEKAKPVDKCFR